MRILSLSTALSLIHTVSMLDISMTRRMSKTSKGADSLNSEKLEAFRINVSEELQISVTGSKTEEWIDDALGKISQVEGTIVNNSGDILENVSVEFKPACSVKRVWNFRPRDDGKAYEIIGFWTDKSFNRGLKPGEKLHWGGLFKEPGLSEILFLPHNGVLVHEPNVHLECYGKIEK